MISENCSKEKFVLVSRVWKNGQFCKLEQCTNCPKSCERIKQPTVKEKQDWN